MPTIAYIANEFPSEVEWYVLEEIRELRGRGVRVIPCSARRKESEPGLGGPEDQSLYLLPPRMKTLLTGLWLLWTKRRVMRDLLRRMFVGGNERWSARARAVAHTVLGACYAALLRNRNVQHIHVHHGYFASWIALVAARLLGVPFSMTLHGSDLLLHGRFLDMKLDGCQFCLTVSEFNRAHILKTYPELNPEKIRVQRLGVPVSEARKHPTRPPSTRPLLLAVGRLHPVKDHVFLLRACHRLRESGMDFQCFIAGEGSERPQLEGLIAKLGLGDIVTLLGPVSRERVQHFYSMADLVVLTSRSEGIPLVLMEAMAHGRIVLAPAITGIPELVIDGKTGYLYRAGSEDDFVQQARAICDSLSNLGIVRQSARQHVLQHFHQQTNLAAFADFFLEQIAGTRPRFEDADLVLQ